MESVDVLVLGAGAMGSAAAWWLAREGRSVVVLERFEPGHHRGSSHGGSRIFRLAYDEPDYVRLAQAAQARWHELEADTGETLLDVTGGVDHGDAASIGRTVAALDACGARYELLDPAEAARRWPHLRFEGGVLFQPDAGRCRADATVAALQRRAADHGADLRFAQGAVVIDDVGDGHVRIRSQSDQFEARVAVVAVGAWTEAVVGAVGVRLPALRVTQEQTFHFYPHDGARPWPSFIHHRLPPIYGLETPGEGVKVAEHGGGAPCDPDHRDFAVDVAGRDRVAAYVARWLPGLDPVPVTEATCLYTTTPTADPVIDRIGPLVVAAGFSGHGFKFTPLFGRLLADLALGRAHQYDRLRLPR